MSDKRVQFDETIVVQVFDEDEPASSVKNIQTHRRSSYSKYINILFMIMFIMIIILILLC
jgi:hypothetical protein